MERFFLIPILYLCALRLKKKFFFFKASWLVSPKQPICHGNPCLHDSEAQFLSSSLLSININQTRQRQWRKTERYLTWIFFIQLDHQPSTIWWPSIVCGCFFQGILGPVAYLSGSDHMGGEEKVVICTVSSEHKLYAWNVHTANLANKLHS